MRFNKSLTFVAVLFSIGFLFSSPLMAAAKKPVLNTLKVKIGGMSCGGCAFRITALLKKIKGVKTASVSFEKKLAVVQYNKAEIKAETIVAAVAKAGYTAKAHKASNAGCDCGKCKTKGKKKCGADCDCKGSKAKKAKKGCDCKDCKKNNTKCSDCKGCKAKKTKKGCDCKDCKKNKTKCSDCKGCKGKKGKS